MKNKHKLYALFGALVLILVIVLFANMNGSLLQGYLRTSKLETQKETEALKIRPLSFERTVLESELDSPIEVAGFSSDRSLKIQEIDLKILPGGFAIDSLHVSLNRTDLSGSLDKASLDFLTCPHCGFTRDEALEAKIRFVKPIEMNALEDTFLVEMKTKAVESRESSLEAEITSISEALDDGSIKIHPVSDLDYVIRASEDIRQEELDLEGSVTLSADSDLDRERVREAGSEIDLAGFSSGSSSTLEGFTIEIESQGNISIENISVSIDGLDVTSQLDDSVRSSLDADSSGTYTFSFKEPQRISAESDVRVRGNVSASDDISSGTITAGVTEVRTLDDEGRTAVREVSDGDIEYVIRIESSSTIESDAREIEYTFDDSSTTLSTGTTEVRESEERR